MTRANLPLRIQRMPIAWEHHSVEASPRAEIRGTYQQTSIDSLHIFYRYDHRGRSGRLESGRAVTGPSLRIKNCISNCTMPETPSGEHECHKLDQAPFLREKIIKSIPHMIRYECKIRKLKVKHVKGRRWTHFQAQHLPRSRCPRENNATHAMQDANYPESRSPWGWVSWYPESVIENSTSSSREIPSAADLSIETSLDKKGQGMNGVFEDRSVNRSQFRNPEHHHRPLH